MSTPAPVYTPIEVTIYDPADLWFADVLGTINAITAQFGDPVPSPLLPMMLSLHVKGILADADAIKVWYAANRPPTPPVPPVPPLPPVPTREQVCNGITTQQGLVIHTDQFGDMPWWGACWPWLNRKSREQAAAQLLAAGNTVCLLGQPMGTPLYNEGGQFYSPDKFGSLNLSDADTVAMVDEALRLGFSAVWMFLDGDDGAAGYRVATDQIRRLAPAMGTLNQYIMYIPGWDGVWHAPAPNVGTGYTPQMVRQWSIDARAAGAVHLGLEHGTGYLPCGEGGGDFLSGGACEFYDAILGEFDDDRFDDTVWQILGRMIRPYHRPPDQPAGDDPGPPFYLGVPSARGPYYYRVFEYHIYDWVRGQTPERVAAAKAYFERCGALNVC